MLFKCLDIHTKWQKITLMSLFLLPISLFWIIISFFRKTIAKPYKSKLFVICVGNLNLGGSGKTPTTMLLSKELQNNGFQLCCLSYGYKGNIVKPTQINTATSYKQCGEEALLLAQYAPTFVSKNRVDGLKYIENNTNYQIVIIDDGYQNPNFIKDYNVLVINGSYGFGNNLIFPAGPLRESTKSGLKKANSIIILEKDTKNIQSKCKKFTQNIYEGFYEHTNIPDTTQQYFAFCGIAMPQKFLNSLSKANLTYADYKFFPDHYMYSNKDIENLIELANKKKLKLITTLKDYVKINKKYTKLIEYLNININLHNTESLIIDIIKKYNEKQ